jgi:hypothetical protein
MTPRLALILGLTASCGGDSLPSAHNKVGSGGGDVAAGTSADVMIPPGALSSDVTITVTPTDAPAPTDMVNVGPAYLFGPEGTQFAVPVTVTLEFDPSLIQAPLGAADVVIYTAPADSTDYTGLVTSLVDGTHVSAQSTHFSKFVATARKHHDMVVDAGIEDAPADATPDAGSACTPVFSGSIQACTYTATCNGHYYSMQCGGSACTCHEDNGPYTQVGNVGLSCEMTTTGQPGWGACGFP